MMAQILDHIGNGFLSDGTKPLPEPVLINYYEVLCSVAVNYRYSRYKIDMKISIDNRYGFSDIDISSF